mgnify:CR=1 FL=1
MRPNRVGRGVGQHGNEAETGARGPTGRQIEQVEVFLRACAPVQGDVAHLALAEAVLQHGLDGCESRAAGEHDDGRPCAFFPDEEVAMGDFHPQHIADLTARYQTSAGHIGLADPAGLMAKSAAPPEADSASLQLPVVGSVDILEEQAGCLKITGWALLWKVEPAAGFIVTVQGSAVPIETWQAVERPDVQQHYPPAPLRSGFEIRIRKSGPLTAQDIAHRLRLFLSLPLDKLDSTVSDAGLSDLTTLAPKILKGEVRGRVVVDVNK